MLKERVLICNCVGFSGYFIVESLFLETTPWLPDNQALVLFNVMVLVDWHSLINFHGFVQNQAESSTCNSWNFISRHQELLRDASKEGSQLRRETLDSTTVILDLKSSQSRL